MVAILLLASIVSFAGLPNRPERAYRELVGLSITAARAMKDECERELPRTRSCYPSLKYYPAPAIAEGKKEPQTFEEAVKLTQE